MSKLINLSDAIQHPLRRSLFEVIQGPFERFLATDRINSQHNLLCQKLSPDILEKSVFEMALEVVNVRFQADPAEIKQIPAEGPLIVVSNHPFGGIEGLIMGAMLSKIRPDVRLLGNYLLKRIAGLGDWIFAVDPFGNRNARSNIQGLKQSIRWVKNGGVLGVFPSGEVASWHSDKRQVSDPDWSPHIASLIRITQATTLPIYFPGKNSKLFYLAGLLRPSFRTAMLPRELVNKSQQTLTIHIGSPIPWQHLRRHTSDESIIHYLRLHSEILKTRTVEQHSMFRFSHIVNNKKQRHVEPVIEPVPDHILKKEINCLPKEQLLVRQGSFHVYIAEIGQIPNLIKEIGRLRELTFRDVQEGTGCSVDLDWFDSHYLHLFLWNDELNELVGAYRLGLTDRILPKFGINGLYTSTLFRFKPGFLHHLSHGIEMGRSFIRSEYQKKCNSLTLIWQGIGAYIYRNPQYNILFGAVSVSRDYHPVSKYLLVRYLMENKLDTEIASYVMARRPYRVPRIPFLDFDLSRTALRNIEDVSSLISEIEKDGKGVPVLLKHYLRLNGKLLGFSIDEEFSNVLDGLLMVNLQDTNPRLLKRFMNRQCRDE